MSIRSPAEITVKRAERGDRPLRIESVTAAKPNERRRTAYYDRYVERGESEHHHKELKNDFTGDRLRLDGGATWEELPGGPGLQGMNLAAHRGKIYRVGGMEPRNEPGDEADNHSVDDCLRFDPSILKWQPLPSLPEPRSSHDVVVLDDKLIVVGGWSMSGRAGNHWLDTVAVLDLASDKRVWRRFPQPFKRRALIAAAHRGKVYVIGGVTEESELSRRVDIYDPKSNTWTLGPDLPGRDRNGFSPAACTLSDQLYVSVADGTLYRFNESHRRWDEVASTTPRIVHRLAPIEDRILVVGGAARKNMLDLIEVVTIDSAARVR